MVAIENQADAWFFAFAQDNGVIWQPAEGADRDGDGTNDGEILTNCRHV